MRTYGRNAAGQWVKVETSPTGDNSQVWLTTLIQTLKLNRGESPFWGNYGIPAQVSVITQIFPDFYVAETQTQFQQYFLALDVQKLPGKTPTYNIVAQTPAGALVEQVAG